MSSKPDWIARKPTPLVNWDQPRGPRRDRCFEAMHGITSSSTAEPTCGNPERAHTAREDGTSPVASRDDPAARSERGREVPVFLDNHEQGLVAELMREHREANATPVKVRALERLTGLA